MKAKTTKADRASFFLAKVTALKARRGPEPSQDGGSLAKDDTITMSDMMAEFSSSKETNISCLIQTLAAELQKEMQDAGLRSAHMEQKMDKFTMAHNSLADKLQELD
ncbi:Hypothetical predicted protein [Pelobates cultripes]|uniref:Uncharacterized protein n=1 Tax=Pelobates cultripes TaxID=61616 RepID=A0AAD1REK1_PELCU|nr:Hypothetical predicted protein [Pelobates cultripes]